MISRILVTTFLALVLVSANGKENKSVMSKSVGEDHVFTHGDIDRTYKMYRPKNLAHNAPLVFVLHGMGSSSTWSYRAGFNDLAEEHGFFVVQPQALVKDIVLSGSYGKSDGMNGDNGKKGDLGKKGDVGKKGKSGNDESCEEGKSYDFMGLDMVCKNGMLTGGIVRWNDDNEDSKYRGQSDVEYLSALAEFLQKKYHLNPEKTFVTGFSNGGFMSYTLMCQAGEVFKAAAPVAGLANAQVFQHCAPGGPKPLLHIHGAEDGMVPIAGNRVGGGKSTTPGAQDLVAYFADLNDSVTTEKFKVTDNATLTLYNPKRGGAEVRYYRIENHDHVWPGGDPGGKGYKDYSGIKATEVIWDFFSRL